MSPGWNRFFHDISIMRFWHLRGRSKADWGPLPYATIGAWRAHWEPVPKIRDKNVLVPRFFLTFSLLDVP